MTDEELAATRERTADALAIADSMESFILRRTAQDARALLAEVERLARGRQWEYDEATATLIEQDKRIVKLETENAALREIARAVAEHDPFYPSAHGGFRCHHCGAWSDLGNAHNSTCEWVLARKLLGMETATD